MPYRDPDMQRRYQREWMARRRAEWFDGKVCVDCGGTERLEVDHVDRRLKSPKLKKTNTSIWSWSQERRDVELAKCVVRCRDCHQRKTIAVDIPQYTNDPPHGTRGRYESRRYRCRCDACKAAKAVENARRYKPS